MDLFSRILVAVDGSEPSRAAVSLGVRLAAPRHDTINFTTVFERAMLDDVLPPNYAPLYTALDAAAETARAAGLEAMCVRRTGYPVEAILDEARKWNATCIAIGTHGRGGIARAVLGSCAADVVRESRVPVLVTPASSAQPGDPFERILCALDDSPAARKAFDAAVALAAEHGAELHLLSVVQIDDAYAASYEVEGFDPDGSMSAIYAEARAAVKAFAADAITEGARVKPHVLGGSDVAERIVQCALIHRCGLIVLGTHGRGGFRRAVLGSVADGVLRSGTLPVLTFRDPRKGERAGTFSDSSPEVLAPGASSR